MSENGLITIASNHSIKETLDRLEASLRGNGVSVFARIDHAAGAASVDMTLPPTELVIFGQPQAGTPLMQAQQSIGIDLPLKMLAWQDGNGKNWLAYNDIAWLAKRHGLGEDLAPAISGIAKALAKLAETAAA